MQKIKILNKDFLLIPVPNDAYDFKKGKTYRDFAKNGIDSTIRYKNNIDTKESYFQISLESEYEFKIINTISNLTEDECEDLVESFILYVGSQRLHEQGHNDKKVYENYIDEQVPCSTSIKSFFSLLKSKNILAKENEDLLLIQINN